MSDADVSIASKIREAHTPAEHLRGILTRLESYLPQIGRGDAAQAIRILSLLDQADALLHELDQRGAALGPERSRFETIKRQLDGKRVAFLKQLGGPEKLAQVRAEAQPSRSRSWWFVDEQLASERWARRRRTLVTAGSLTGVVIVLGILYTLFLAPDEATRGRFRYEQNAEQALTQGDPAEALAHAERALSYAPDDAELLVLKGVSLELLGSEVPARDAYDEARARYDNAEDFFSGRAQVYMIANRPELALADTDRMIALNPDSALAYFQRGNAYATLGNYTQAVTDMETASALAEAADQTELQGMARVQLGNFMMMMSAPQLEEPTLDPE